ncbi:MAG: hypothetical protein HXK63_01655 [Campylobacter sp.]|nr:hypothetical protein [Campylobacter sp.]
MKFYASSKSALGNFVPLQNFQIASARQSFQPRERKICAVRSRTDQTRPNSYAVR